MASRLFVSHSSEDDPVLKELVDLLQLSISGLEAEDIRYTSWTRTGLGAGDSVTRLLSEVRTCSCFLAVVSDSFIGSRFCNAEYAVGMTSDCTFLAGHLPGVQPSRLSGLFTDRNIVDLSDPEAVQGLLDDVADSDERWEYRHRGDKVEFFCQAVKAHPPNPLERVRRRLVQQIPSGEVYLNAYGLLEPTRREVFQDFHPRAENIQPVQYLWADPRLRNSISAALHRGPQAAESFLRIVFTHRPNSLGCNIAFRPLNREALVTAGASRLVFDARVADESDLDEIGAQVRLVNGYMQHWQPTVGAEMLRFERGDFQRTVIDLSPRGWELFEQDGTGVRGPRERSDFGILSSLNLELGGYQDLARAPTAGSGTLDIREIRVEQPTL